VSIIPYPQTVVIKSLLQAVIQFLNLFAGIGNYCRDAYEMLPIDTRLWSAQLVMVYQ
jgi:hypothetical protein